MTNIAIILTLLVTPYLVAWVFHLNVAAGGRIGLCAVFLFAAIGHFFKTEQMLQMLPSWVPARRALIYLSGVVEVLFAIAVLAMPNPFYVGLCIIGYLIVIFPSNIYAASHRISFGGHSIGPRYLLVRLPLQLLLIGGLTGSLSEDSEPFDPRLISQRVERATFCAPLGVAQPSCPPRDGLAVARLWGQRASCPLSSLAIREDAQSDGFYPLPVNGRNSSRTIFPFFTV